ncbi:MAG: TIGR00266 family protein [Actinomycetes bacterium]|jgi:uncharacterized protein (TIGR00266 family)|nr:TIGR00266 family protein [Actinomycetes bacterium]
MQYKIMGETFPVVECQLDAGETMKTEGGSMTWMSPNMHMETSGGGSVGKALGRMLSGESMFFNHYTAQGGPGMITFGSSFPGSIRAIDVTPGMSVICQKRSFLACEMGVDLSVFFQKKLGAGIFGGEGFIMQKLTGQGMAFLEVDGYAVDFELAAGQSIVLNTGYLVMMDETCKMDIERVHGLKNIALGGEGLFNTRVTGPGKIVVQTMPLAGVAAALAPFIASKG